jgi:hypothetical protein
MIYRGPGFLSFVRFGSSPTFFPVSKLDRRLTGRLRKIDNLLTGEGEKGVGEEPNHTTGCVFAIKILASRPHKQKRIKNRVQKKQDNMDFMELYSKARVL